MQGLETFLFSTDFIFCCTSVISSIPASVGMLRRFIVLFFVFSNIPFVS